MLSSELERHICVLLSTSLLVYNEVLETYNFGFSRLAFKPLCRDGCAWDKTLDVVL